MPLAKQTYKPESVQYDLTVSGKSMICVHYAKTINITRTQQNGLLTAFSYAAVILCMTCTFFQPRKWGAPQSEGIHGLTDVEECARHLEIALLFQHGHGALRSWY